MPRPTCAFAPFPARRPRSTGATSVTFRSGAGSRAWCARRRLPNALADAVSLGLRECRSNRQEQLAENAVHTVGGEIFDRLRLQLYMTGDVTSQRVSPSTDRRPAPAGCPSARKSARSVHCAFTLSLPAQASEWCKLCQRFALAVY